MLDVIVAGAGPAGAIAAMVLARAGARVLVVDRDAFPRDKLCGDTLNPGALALLRSLGLSRGPLDLARPLVGMLVTGPRASARGEYRGGRAGLAITRRELDSWLLDEAIRAGARFESGLVVQHALTDERSPAVVRGLVLKRRHGDEVVRIPATMTIAADGRRSAVARSLGLVTHPAHPRRWAFGVYASGVALVSNLGEMHVRSGYYLGIAPLTDTVSNVCVVTGPRPDGPAPLDVIRRAIARDRTLADRFAGVEFNGPVRVLGPLAADARTAGAPGLLLAGDAAGFIDPMTGDGLHLAMRGAVLAASEALHALETGDLAGAPGRLDAARHRALAPKLRFNRTLRALVGSPVAVGIAGWGATIAPGLFAKVVRYAGDTA